MTMEILQGMKNVFYITAGVLICVEIVLLFIFKIWKVIGDLSGVNKKRAIKQIFKQNHAIKNNSQNFYAGKEYEEIKTQQLECMEETGCLEQQEVEERCILVRQLEYIGSSTWIE